MRIEFDASKSRIVKRQHGISLEQAAEIFEQAYIIDVKNDDPQQFRAIGWFDGRLYSVIFETRRDAVGEYFHLITAWKATKQEQESYAKNI